jgi:hypothetical protein
MAKPLFCPMCKTEQTTYIIPCIAYMEILMPREESAPDTTAPDARTAASDLDSAPRPPGGTEPLPDASTSRPESGAPDYSWRTDALLVRKSVAIDELFVTRKWHRSYAEALLETDVAKLPVLIAAAGEAILARYAELVVVPIPADEILDLQHAVVALSQLSGHIAASAVGPPDIC